MEFYICHCGNTSDNHNFRHSFEKLVKVERKLDENGLEIYIINSKMYPEQKQTVCSVDGCRYNDFIHNTTVVRHAFAPVEKRFREIKFTLPEDSVCRMNGCKILKEHDGMSHLFWTKVEILNKEENDKIFIVDRKDEDNKIIWE